MLAGAAVGGAFSFTLMRSKVATNALGRFGWPAIGAVGGFTSNLTTQWASKGWEGINWGEVGFSTALGAGGAWIGGKILGQSAAQVAGAKLGSALAPSIGRVLGSLAGGSMIAGAIGGGVEGYVEGKRGWDLVWETTKHSLASGAGAFGTAGLGYVGGKGFGKAFHSEFVENRPTLRAATSWLAEAMGFEACFAAGTPLRTPEGSRYIEDFLPGDLVLSRDEHNPGGLVVAKLVEAVFVREALVWHLHIGGQVVRTTAEHPFYVGGKGWTATNLLSVGDLLLDEDGQWVPVEDILDTGEWETVYNLRIADFHTYFVGDASWGFAAWAHNADRCGGSTSEKAKAKSAAMEDMAYEDAILHNEDVPYYKASGTYELEFASGMRYHGKGLESRMEASAIRVAAEHGDTVTKKSFTPANNEVEAFLVEAQRIAADGGIEGGKLYNKINSPGKNKGDK